MRVADQDMAASSRKRGYGMMQNGVRRVWQLVALILVVALMPVGAGAAEISIKPGKFSHFNLIAPESIIAGETATLQLQAVDAYNNIITNFSEQATEFRLTATGNATVSPLAFRAGAFSNGAYQFTLRDTSAETVSIAVFESASPIALVTREIRVQPAKAHAFRISAPRTAGAGEKFNVRITAVDSHGNVVTAPLQGKNLNILFKGDTEPRLVEQGIPDFVAGVCTLSLLSEKIGAFTFEAKDLVTSVSGASDRIEITNGPLHSFRIVTPRESLAGETFEIAIVALDAYNNLVRNYTASGSGVTLASTGSMKPFPSTILAYEFQNGQAKVQVRYDNPEDIQLIASEISRKVSGKSDVIHIAKAVPSRYEVTTPDSAVAGQRFKVKVTAYNQKGDVIRNYNLSGPDVLLNATGTGKLTPGRIPASEFINGTAVINAQYNKSESFTITAVATDPPERTQLPASVKKRLEKSEKQAQSAAKTESGAAKKGKKSVKKTKQAAPRAELRDIAFTEDKRPKLSLNLANAKNVKPAVSVIRRDGKQWVAVKLPTTSSALSLPLRLDSAWVGDVLIDDDAKKGGIVLRVELLQAAKLKVQKEKNSLVIFLK